MPSLSDEVRLSSCSLLLLLLLLSPCFCCFSLLSLHVDPQWFSLYIRYRMRATIQIQRKQQKQQQQDPYPSR